MWTRQRLLSVNVVYCSIGSQQFYLSREKWLSPRQCNQAISLIVAPLFGRLLDDRLRQLLRLLVDGVRFALKDGTRYAVLQTC